MKRIWPALVLYAVSLAVFIFQFVLAMGYSDPLYYTQMVIHAALWFVTYYLARRVSKPLALIAPSVIAASLISLAPVDLMAPALFDYPAEAWLAFVLRFVIHLTCLVAMVLVVRRAEGST